MVRMLGVISRFRFEFFLLLEEENRWRLIEEAHFLRV